MACCFLFLVQTLLKYLGKRRVNINPMRRKDKRGLRKNDVCYKLCLIIGIIFSAFTVRAQRNHLITESDFENKLLGAGWDTETCCSYSLQHSDSVARAGSYSARIELRRTDPLVANGVRSEIRFTKEPMLKVERWYAFSVFLPSNHIPDPEPEIIAQWHDIPDFDRGETWRSPPIALFSENGKWRLHILWATDTVNTNQTRSGEKFVELGAYETANWTDWVFHIRFSWENEGFIDVYKDGVLINSIKGPNAYNDKHGTYFKMGVYKWMWMPKNDRGQSVVKQRVVFYDEVRIGDEKASYIDVAPDTN